MAVLSLHICVTAGQLLLQALPSGTIQYSFLMHKPSGGHDYTSLSLCFPPEDTTLYLVALGLLSCYLLGS